MLQIEFTGYPVESVRWERNGEPLPRSLSNESSTTSSLLLAPNNIEQGDLIKVTVNVLNKSLQSSETVVVVLCKSSQHVHSNPPIPSCGAVYVI